MNSPELESEWAFDKQVWWIVKKMNAAEQWEYSEVFEKFSAGISDIKRAKRLVWQRMKK